MLKQIPPGMEKKKFMDTLQNLLETATKDLIEREI